MSEETRECWRYTKEGHGSSCLKKMAARRSSQPRTAPKSTTPIDPKTQRITLKPIRREPSKIGGPVPVGSITVLSSTPGKSYGYAFFSDCPNTVVAGTGGTGYINTNYAKVMENTAVSRDADRCHVKGAPDESFNVKKHRDHCKTHDETGKDTDVATTVIVDYIYVTTIVDVTMTGKYAHR